MPPRIDPRYVKPKKISVREKPRGGRARNLTKAKREVLKNFSELEKRMKALEPQVRKHNESIQKRLLKALDDYAKRVRSKKQPLPFDQMEKIEQKHAGGIRNVYQEAYHGQLGEVMQAFGPSSPDIDELSMTTIEPGQSILFWGTGFGPTRGKVFLQVTSQERVELGIQGWSVFEVGARLADQLEALRPYHGKIWIETAEGETSNAWPIMFHPKMSIYASCPEIVRSEVGWYWGGTEDGVILASGKLNDPDFTVDHVHRRHRGNGWSEFRPPHASGQSLAQGYHIGVRAFGYAEMRIRYFVVGPKGIWPPAVKGVQWWSHVGPSTY